jgi:hypothetical protein
LVLLSFSSHGLLERVESGVAKPRHFQNQSRRQNRIPKPCISLIFFNYVRQNLIPQQQLEIDYMMLLQPQEVHPPSGISTGSHNTETTDKSSRTSKNYNSKNQCTAGDNNPETTQDVAVPKVIVLGSGVFLNDTHETSEEISILNVTIARKEKLDLTNTSTDTSVTSVTSSNNASNEEHAENDPAVANVPVFAKGRRNISPFNLFRIQYLVVHTAIMLADGLQGKSIAVSPVKTLKSCKISGLHPIHAVMSLLHFIIRNPSLCTL